MEKQVKEMELLDRPICENFWELVITCLLFSIILYYITLHYITLHYIMSLKILLGRDSFCILLLLVCGMGFEAEATWQKNQQRELAQGGGEPTHKARLGR